MGPIQGYVHARVCRFNNDVRPIAVFECCLAYSILYHGCSSILISIFSVLREAPLSITTPVVRLRPVTSLFFASRARSPSSQYYADLYAHPSEPSPAAGRDISANRNTPLHYEHRHELSVLSAMERSWGESAPPGPRDSRSRDGDVAGV